jgi:hypothetical protein
MTNLITVTNCTTGETIERKMTADELAQFNAIKADQAQQAQAQAQIETDKIRATAKLEALGLTADDLKALGL